MSAAGYLDGLRTVCRDWKTLLRGDAVYGRRVLRDLRIDRVIVRRDDQGRWWFRLDGSIDKIAGVTGRDFAVTDEPFATWADGPGETDDPWEGLTDAEILSTIADPAETADQHAWGSCPRQG
jgi:hypothetical protein